jgi:hypothetical protein
VATVEGELTNISRCVPEDDGFHVNGSLVVAPDFFIKNQIELLKLLVSYCGGRTVLILCPVPRYVTFRCCDDPGHCTNFDDPAYIATLISDLARVQAAIMKAIPEATAVDTLETLGGQGNKNMEFKVEVVKSCWSQDPVHANLHAYFKLASNTIQLIEGGLKNPSSVSSKRPRAASETSQRGTGSGSRTESGSGFGFGPSGSGPAKKQKFQNRFEFSSGDSHGYGHQGRFENYHGGRGGGGGQSGNRSGGLHGYYEHQNKGGYGSSTYRQQRDDRYYQPR